MDNKEMMKKIHSKEFLKKNEFAELVAQVNLFVKKNKLLVTVVLIAVLFFGLGMPSWRMYQSHLVEKFNLALYEADKSLKKADDYQFILKTYGNIPASQYARLKLVDHLTSRDQTEEALKVLEDGIKRTGDPDIFSTLLVIKHIDLLKGQNKYLEAADFATNHYNHVLKTYLPDYKLLQGNLLVLAGKKDEARAIYQKIIAEVPVADHEDPKQKTMVSPAVQKAKDQILLLDLGVL